MNIKPIAHYAAFLIITLSLFNRLQSLPFVTKSINHYPEYEKEALIELMRESNVTAVIIGNSRLYKSLSDESSVVMVLTDGARVRIMTEQSRKWYFIRDEKTGKTGWIKREALTIPEESPVNKTRMDKAQLEGYANIMGFQSDTAYFVLTDIDRQLTHVFKGSKFNWTLIRTIECSTGKNESPTKTGHFKLQTRGLWFYSERLASGGKYWVRFDGTYLFHSVAMNRQGEIIDGTIGEKSSSGCVRFSVPDAKWFYENVPDGTSVFVI